MKPWVHIAIIACAAHSAFAGCPIPRSRMTNPAVTSVLNRLNSGGSFSGIEIMHLSRLHLTQQLAAALLDGTTQRRKTLDRPGVDLMADLGRDIIPEADGGSERFSPIVTNPPAVAYVACLLESPDSDARDEAGAILADQVPAAALTPLAKAILDALHKFPGVTGGALILGRLGSKQALDLLESSEDLRLTSPDDTEIALARLGDKAAEARVLSSYRTAAGPREKADQALRVGYAATRDAILTLARDFRTGESYVWRMNSRRSLRISIAAGLHRAFLSEPIFWKPEYKPHDDSYYERIEAWITAKMGVTWTQPRPPFLYEEDAPLPPGVH